MKEDSLQTGIQGQSGREAAGARLEAVITTAAINETDKSAWVAFAVA